MKKNDESLTLLSYNIHKGFSAGNRRFVLHEIRQAVRAVDADIVFLQEVLGEHRGHSERIFDWPDASQFTFLADELWPHVAYGKNRVHALGHHGNAILSKFPIVQWKNVDVSKHRFERRGLLQAVLDVPGCDEPLYALCVHLGLAERDRRSQVADLCQLVEAEVPDTSPLVIAGDFNDWSVRANRTLARRLLVQEVFQCLHGRSARTFPSWLPMLCLDRMYCRGLSVEHAEVLRGRAWRRLSDHVALFATLRPSDDDELPPMPESRRR